MATALDRGPRFDEELDNSELLEWCFKCRTESKEKFEPRWKDATKYWKTYASESLSATDKQHLSDTDRPDIDPPFAAGVVETILGQEMAQQMEPTFHGVDDELEDEIIAQWLTTLVRNGFGVTNAGAVLLKCWLDCLIGGYGFVEWYVDLHKLPFRVVPKKLNYWQVWPDPKAVEENLTDARWWVVDSVWTLEDAKASWSSPEQQKMLDKAAAAGKGKLSSQDALPKLVGGAGAKSNAKDSVTIIKFQYRRAMAMVHYWDPEEDEEKDVTREEYEKRKEAVNREAAIQDAAHQEALSAWQSEVDQAQADYRAQQEMQAAMPMEMMAPPAPPELPPQPEAPQPLRFDEDFENEVVTFYNGHTYRRAFICGSSKHNGSVLEDKEISLPVPGAEPGFTIRCVTGYAWSQGDEEQVQYFGVMAKIGAIQEWFTYAIRSYLELQARRIKGGGFVRMAAFDGVPGGFEAFVKSSSTPGKWHLVAGDGPLSELIHENPSVQGDQGPLEAMRTMKDMFGWVTTVSQGVQGSLTADRSKVLVENQQNASLTALLVIRDPYRHFLLSCGRLFAAIATKHLQAKELDRILGTQKVEGMTVQRDPSGQLGPDGQPALVPMTDAQGQPMTAGRILKKADLLEFDLAADVSAATLNQRIQTWTAFEQHGLAGLMRDALPGPEGSRIWVPQMLKSAPLGSASDAKAMAEEAHAYLTKLVQQEEPQGILSSFQQLMQSDPAQASQVLQQLAEALQGAGGQEGEAAAGQEQAQEQPPQ